MRLARVRRRKRFILSAVTAAFFTTVISATAAPGDLDPTFDGDGKVTTHFIHTEEARSVAIQSDGKIVAAGVAICEPCLGPVKPHDFALARYNRDGSLDPTFDGDGKVTTDFDLSEDEAFAVAVQANGKIIAAGSANGPGALDFALARYNPDGSLDLTFGGDGKVTTDFSSEDDEAHGLAIQADGKIVAAGYAVVLTHNLAFAVARYNVDGSLDPTFDGDGRVTTFFEGGDRANAVAIQADGKIVAVGVGYTPIGGVGTDGPSSDNFALARYNPDGSMDPTFGRGGLVTAAFGNGPDAAFAVDIQDDGKIVAAGSATLLSGAVVFALTRHELANGYLDPTFGGGAVTTQLGNGDEARGVAIQRDGRIVAAGLACEFCFAGSDFGLARYNPDGSLDTTFSGDGRVMTDFGFANDQAFAVAIQSDGKIVGAGVAGDDFALARYKVCRVSSRRSSIPCR